MLDLTVQFIVDKIFYASPAELQNKSTADGRWVTYKTCVDACVRLKAQLFGKGPTKDQFISSYALKMNKSGLAKRPLVCNAEMS